MTPAGRALLEDAPTTIQTQLMTALRRLGRDEQKTLATLLERWLREAKIDFASPPMLGEDEVRTSGKPSRSHRRSGQRDFREPSDLDSRHRIADHPHAVRPRGPALASLMYCCPR